MILKPNKLHLLFLLLPALPLSAQNITTNFYDYRWRPCEVPKARFYSTVENTDSGWLRNDYFLSTQRLQMSALFKDSACKIKNGNAIYFFADGRLEASGRYINNKKEGIYISYHYNGMMSDSGNYHNGKIIGYKMGWHPNGFISDSTESKNDSTLIDATWFDNGNPSAYGVYINNKKHGKWHYFHRNGKEASVEMNDHGKVTEVVYFNEDGAVLKDTAMANREAVYKNGEKDWSKYLYGKIYWPSEYKLINTDTADVMSLFTIDEEGKVTDYYIEVPYHQLIDKIAIDALKNCPAWKPAIDHNRRIKAYRRQPLTFIQEQ